MDRFIFDTIQVQCLVPTAVLGAVAATTADSFQVKDAQDTYLLPAFGHHQVTGILQVRAPSFQDNNNGIQVRNIAAQPYPLWPALNPPQKVGRVDNLNVQFSGSAVAGQIETAVLPMFYRNPAQQNAATLLDVPGLRQRGSGLYTTVTTTLTGGVAGGYSGPVVLNAAANTYNLIGGKQYALVGLHVDTVCAAITVRGPGTGQTRIAVPGHPTNKDLTGNYLYWLSLKTGLPTMPVISSLDAGVTTVEVVCNQAGGTFIVNLIFMLLN